MPDLKKMLTLEALSEALPSWLKRSTKPEYNADEIDSANTTNQFVSASDKDNWNAKGTYSKPSGGIPKSDLSSIVQTSLEKADSALQSETDPTVPSWAKQPDKPSYTQDEVPDGTTYKRVTQTEKDTWSGKQNALTTTQMQAVNSGITAEKVTQISTNQANISYTLGKTGKNLVNPELFTEGGYISDTSNGIVIVSNTSVYMDYLMISPNTEYFITSVGSSGSWGAWYDSNKNFISGINAYGMKTSPANAKYIRCTVSYNNLNPNYATTFMICTKADYDASPDYQPYRGLPNADLTQLQSEDRAALVEQVDEGAKNALYLDIDKIKSIHTGGTWTGNTYVNGGITTTIKDDGTIELYGTATSAYNFAIFGDDSGTTKYAGMELSGCPTGGSDSTYYMYAMSSDYASQGSDYGNGAVISNNPISRVRIRVLKNTDMGTEQSPTIFKPMICTVADWKISKNHAPFALTNTDLTKAVATKAPALSTSTAIDSGSLDDVAENTFAVYASTVTNVPTSDDYYVETIVYDASNALQKAYNYTDGTSYVRVKNSATWGNWKQITNA